MRQSQLKLGVSLAALFVASVGQAMAQQAPATNAPATPSVQTAAAPASDSSSAIDEIVVTSERRSQSVRDVPVTIQAFSSAALEDRNIYSLEDLLKFTPNVAFANNGPGQGNIYMRGLSTGFAGSQSSAAVGGFPNVAIYLDDQSMQFPARNVDVYMADMERVEVLEGPQGTLFGGGAEAGAIRYITNKPKLGQFEASVEGSYGFTSGGGDNNSVNAMINVPIIDDRLAARLVVYNERQGGYIDNVPSTFKRSDQDLGNYYIGIKPNAAGICPDGGTPGKSKYCTLSTAPTVNNASVAGKDQNPTTFTGARLSIDAQVADDWNVLITESLSNLDAEGMNAQFPVGSNFQTLQPLQTTYFSPTYDHDKWNSTSLTVNGKVSDISLVYTGSYMSRQITQQMDYTNYARSVYGAYYQCTGGNTPWATGKTPTCYSPVGYWQDNVQSQHYSQEFRASTPSDWRIRGIAGLFWEDFKIEDVMNFNYKSIPVCDGTNAATGCANDVATFPGSTANDPGVRSDNTAFGEDLRRGYNQKAAFASVDIDIIPQVLTITGGTRFYRYEEEEEGSLYQTGPACIAANPCYKLSIDAENEHSHYEGFVNRANVVYHVEPDLMAYFTFSEGFRPGAFNRSAKSGLNDGAGNNQFIAPLAYQPDSLTNYEIGVKWEGLDRRVQINTSAYIMDWTNVQQFLYNPTYGLNNTVGINGADYEIKGLEFQLVAKPLQGWTVNNSFSFNQSSQTSSPCLSNDNPKTATDGNVIGAAPGQCITQAKFNGGINPVPNVLGVIGGTTPFSPKWQGNLHVRYDYAFGEYRTFISFGGNYVGSMNNQPVNYTSGAGVIVPNTTFLFYKQPSYYTLDANLGVRKDNWNIGLFGSNLNNSHASTFTSSAQFIESQVPIRPMVVGLKCGVNF
jgi:outer membrane receptor protein involved in Fe transport